MTPHQDGLPALPEPVFPADHLSENDKFSTTQMRDYGAACFEAGKLAAAIRAGSCVPNLSDEDLNSRWRDPDNAGRRTNFRLGYRLAQELAAMAALPLPVQGEAEIERLAVEHEDSGFGRVGAEGFTGHIFSPEGFGNFVRAMLAAHPKAQPASPERKPLTDEQKAERWSELLPASEKFTSADWFEAGVCFAEETNGIAATQEPRT